MSETVNAALAAFERVLDRRVLAALATEKFAGAVLVSLRAFALGMVLALLAGIPAGVLMARVRGAGRVLGVWVNVFVSAPVSALVPILMAVIGIGEPTVVVTVVLFAVFVIALDTEVGVRQADRSLVEMARAFGARPHQVYTKVLVWSALPEILAGVRLGAIRGVKGVVIGQRAVDVKHHEIPEFQPLLEPLELAGKLVTADALHTQREHARFLVEEKHADYLFTVKGNQSGLLADLVALDQDAFSPSGRGDR